MRAGGEFGESAGESPRVHLFGEIEAGRILVRLMNWGTRPHCRVIMGGKTSCAEARLTEEGRKE